jgi:FkbM family methyltransferase
VNSRLSASFFQAATLASHTLLPHLLRDGCLIVDLGANRGEFFHAVCAWCKPGRYIAVEPNPVLADALRSEPNLEVVNAAITAADTPVHFQIDSNLEASRIVGTPTANSVEVNGLSLGTLLDQFRFTRVDLLKVDIEGAELPMLAAGSADVLLRATQIAVEFHDFCGLCPAREVEAAVRRVISLGFRGIRFADDNSNWLFVRRDAPGVARTFVAAQMTARLRRAKHRLNAQNGKRRASRALMGRKTVETD